MPVAMSAITAGLGGLATLTDPLPDHRPARCDAGTWSSTVGVFLGLIAAAGITYGGWMAMQEEGTSFSGQADAWAGEATRHRPHRRLRTPPSSTGPAA